MLGFFSARVYFVDYKLPAQTLPTAFFSRTLRQNDYNSYHNQGLWNLAF